MDIVLYEPEIPQNTGSIGRTCAATKTPLCIVGEAKFEISDKRAKRAGLDYWPYVELHKFNNWEEYITHRGPSKVWAFTKFGNVKYYTATFSPEDALLFGGETKGLPDSIIELIPFEQQLCIPMVCKEVRSLNLSNAVSIALYEARRQLGLDDETELRATERVLKRATPKL
jgi:tRNA (cytidine/uridine-2'-O-)-methyltransferase